MDDIEDIISHFGVEIPVVVVFMLLLLLLLSLLLLLFSSFQDRVYLPQMWSMKTEAMKRRLMTRTGTGPTFRPGESSV